MLNRFTDIRDAVVGEEALLKTADLAELGGAEIKDVLANQINVNLLQIDKEIGSVCLLLPCHSLNIYDIWLPSYLLFLIYHCRVRAEMFILDHTRVRRSPSRK